MPRPTLLVLALLLAACGPSSANDDGGGGGEDGFADGRTLVQVLDLERRPPRVDLILVVDDSASFGPFTDTWAANLPWFADVIASDDGPADVRVAITTTSVPGPTCAGPRARGGEPIVESCRAHLDDFAAIAAGEPGAERDRRAACEQACSLTEIPRVLSPGRDEHDLASLAIRPWIEPPHNPHGGNLDGVDLAEALACAGLQGHAGCEFERPIEAAARMVEHLTDPTHPLGEFRRPDAALMILFVGDEDDCSHPDSSATIFDPAGDRTFWPDPDASAPSSGICIAAGVVCDDQGCRPSAHGLDGAPIDDPAAGVLTPTSRLHEALVAAGEYEQDPWVPYVAAVGGFSSDGGLHYTDPLDGVPADAQGYFDAFGVVPGCTGGPADARRSAAPGGRLAEAVTDGSLYSVCDDVWVAPLEAFASQIKPGIQPWCMSFACVADLAPADPWLEPDCVVEEVDYAGARTNIPQCERDADGWRLDPDSQDYVLPPGADACWVHLTDADGVTADPADDMDVVCREEGLIGQTKIIRRPGSFLAYDSVYALRCRPC